MCTLRVTARSTVCPGITCFPNEGVEGDCNRAEGAAPRDTLFSSNSVTGSRACFSNTGLDRGQQFPNRFQFLRLTSSLSSAGRPVNLNFIVKQTLVCFLDKLEQEEHSLKDQRRVTVACGLGLEGNGTDAVTATQGDACLHPSVQNPLSILQS